MLPFKNRLKKEADLKKVFQEGKSFVRGPLVLRILKTKMSDSRFGFIVSHQVSKKAVFRNKVKRKLREAVKRKMGAIQKGIDGIFIARPGIENKKFFDINDMVGEILDRAKIIKKQ